MWRMNDIDSPVPCDERNVSALVRGKRLDQLRDRLMTMLRELSPRQAETWAKEAEPFIQSTARAVEVVCNASVAGAVEPALPFTDFAPSVPAAKKPTAGLGEFDRDDPLAGNGNPGGVDSKGCGFSVIEAATALRRGEVSSVELVRMCLAQIEATDGDIAAWTTVDREGSLASARRADEALRNGIDFGPFHGIPVGVKDNICTKGMPTEGGSELYKGYIPRCDAAAVAALKRGGAIVLGKTTTTEMALGDPPATRNPWNLHHTPGGSSSGSAAAVAAGHVPVALATQTGGSMNRPASYCGLTALKTTYGAVSRRGVFPVAWTLDHVGGITTNAIDQILLVQVLSGLDLTPSRPHHDLRGRKVGRPDRYFFEGLSPAQREAYDDVLRTLETEFGMSVVDITLPPAFEAAAAAHGIIMQCELAAAYPGTLRRQGELMRPMLRSRMLCGHATHAIEYLRAQQIRQLYIEQLTELLKDIDFLATPTTPSPAPHGIDTTGSSAFNAPFTVSGFPTVVFPTGFAPETGLPLSTQFVASPHQEAMLLHLARTYQDVTEWHCRRPMMRTQPGS